MPTEKPTPPFPDQHIEPPGEEAKMSPRPRYRAPDYRAAGKLENRVALITGGDSGIGRAVAVLFAREGADVALVYLDAEQRDAEETRRQVEAEGRTAELVPGDVRDSDFCSRAVETTVERFGRLDVLVNNAAFQRHRGGLDQVTLEQWETTFRTNIFGYFFMARSAVPHMQPGRRHRQHRLRDRV